MESYQKKQARSQQLPDAGLRRMYRILKAKSRAITNEKEWFIEYEAFKRLSAMDCHYCGLPPMQKAYAQTWDNQRKKFVQDRERFVLYNGLDRVDNTKEYQEQNVVPCCKLCNWAKRDLPVNEFLQWVDRVQLYQKIKNYSDN